MRPKVTDFLDVTTGAGSPAIQFARSVQGRIGHGALPASLATVKRSQSSPPAGASAFATSDAAKFAILRDFAVHAKLPCSVHPQCIVILPGMRESAGHSSAGSGGGASSWVS